MNLGRRLSGSRSVERFEFRPHELGRVVRCLESMTVERQGWVNLLPGIEEGPAQTDELPGIFGLLGGGPPPVTMCTWVPPRSGRTGAEEVTIGVLHPLRRKVLRELADASMGLPPDWRLTQDHPRRGLVVNVPLNTPAEDVVAWLLGAGTLLCPMPLTGSWQAEVHSSNK